MKGARRGMLGSSPDELCSEGRGVKTTGGARARRGVLCRFRWVDVPDPQRGEKWWRGVIVDISEAASGAEFQGRLCADILEAASGAELQGRLHVDISEAASGAEFQGCLHADISEAASGAELTSQRSPAVRSSRACTCR